jgi:hypothetical protein
MTGVSPCSAGASLKEAKDAVEEMVRARGI